MRRLVTTGLCLAVLTGVGNAQPALEAPAVQQREGICAPAMLTRMVVRNISPGLAAAAPAAQPRSIWRKGSTQLRTEEVPDPSRGVHNIVVVSSPDIWMINMTGRSGQHSVDPGPTYEVRAPILPVGSGMPGELIQLEYGCEAEFVAARMPGAPRPVAWGIEAAQLHTAVFGEHELSILMHVRRKAPLMVVYAKGGQAAFAIRYDEFRSGLPDRPDLFAPPKNVRIMEAQPQSPPPSNTTPGDRL